MKSTLFLFFVAVVLDSFQCFSQSEHRHQGRPVTNATLQRVLNAQQARLDNAKGTMQRARVVALSTYNTGVLSDTVHYFYSNGRGSRPLRNEGILQYSPTYLVYPNNDGYPGAVAYPMVSCDSLSYFQSSSGGPLNLAGRTIVNFLASNKISTDTQASYSSTGRVVNVFEYTYNPAGFISRDRVYDSLQAGASPYLPYSDDYYDYDAMNNMISDSSVNIPTGQPVNKFKYTNNAAGYPTLVLYYTYSAGAWMLSDSSVYAYDANNRMLTVVSYNIVGGIAYATQSDSLAYSGVSGLEVYDRTFYYTNTTHALFLAYYFYGHLNAAGDNYDTTSGYVLANGSTGAQVPSDREVSIFNADGTLAQVDYYAGTPAGFSATATYSNFVYYEQYNATTIAPAVHSTNTFIVFPNPANGTAYLRLSLIQDMFLDVTITDICGRVMTRVAKSRMFHEGLTEEPIDLKGLSNGLYFLGIHSTQLDETVRITVLNN